MVGECYLASLPDRGGRITVESVAGCSWNGWQSVRGIGGRIIVEYAVRHTGSALTGKHSDFSIYHGHRNMVWTYFKNMPWVLFWALLPVHLAMNIVSIIWFVSQGQGRAILRAKWGALCGIPKMWRKRQQIQKNRVASISEIWHLLNKSLLPGRRG